MYAYIKDTNIIALSHSPIPRVILDEEGEEIENPAIEGSEEMEYENTITNPSFDGEKIVHKESPEEQKSRVIASILSAEDLSTVDLEGLEFSDIEIGDIIVQKVFAGNPYAQTALLRKVAKIQESKIAGLELSEEEQATLDYANAIDAEIETLLTFFYHS